MKRRKAQDGQILVLFAGMLVLLLAMAAVAIDVSSVLSARRAYRTAADAAALAGAQELQRGITRVVDATEYGLARETAKDLLEKQLGATSACDPLSGNTLTCAFGTSFKATIRTPINAGDCVSCAPNRSVEVKVANPNFALSFARVFGINTYNVAVGAVAGLSFQRSYAIQTLRPPQPLGGSGGFDVRDIRVDGGTHIIVNRGDVGSNSNMEYAGTGSILQLDPGYDMYYYDPYHGPTWGASPIGQKLPASMEDPGYHIPTRTATTPSGIVTHADVDATCRARAEVLWGDAHYKPLVPTDRTGAAIDYTMIDCYSKGIYPAASSGPGAGVDNGRLGILEPGVFFFDGRFTVNGSLVGGYTAASEGVALVFLQTGEFKNRTGGSGINAVVLNAGSRYGNSAGVEATPAKFDGAAVQTDGDPHLILTLLVVPDTRCVVGPTYPTGLGCDETDNLTLNLAGGTSLYLAGVQYAPSDNSTIAGGSDGNGYVGQIISWTIRYTGGSIIRLLGPDIQRPGLLRLDGACTAPGTPCAP